jgi:hypothetical protein
MSRGSKDRKHKTPYQQVRKPTPPPSKVEEDHREDMEEEQAEKEVEEALEEVRPDGDA